MRGFKAHVAASRKGEGELTLLEYLDRKVPRGARVSVTGHSKGGALTHATALWLAEDWAPRAGTQISCWSFAGPTGGNDGFARHYGTTLAAHTRRIVNTSDLVPSAWNPTDLERIARIYPRLARPIRVLATAVGPRKYTHHDGTLVEFDGDRRFVPLAQELIHQHLDAYLEEAGFSGPTWNARAIMLG